MPGPSHDRSPAHRAEPEGADLEVEVEQVAEAAFATAVAGRVHGYVRRHGGSAADPLGGTAVGDDVVATLKRRSGRGAPLDQGLATSLGQQYGADLSGVRVHTDPEADTISRSMQAVAFTHGNDVYFSAGSYSPGTAAGQRLIAHEAAHVAQGHSGRATSGGGPGLTIGQANDPVEAEADRMADAALGAIRRQASLSGAAPAADHVAGCGCGTGDAVVHRTAHVRARQDLGAVRRQAAGATSTGHGTGCGCGTGDTVIHRTAHVRPRQDLGAVRRQAQAAHQGTAVIRRGFFGDLWDRIGGKKPTAGEKVEGARKFPATVAIGQEQVKVASADEEKEAADLIAVLQSTYGITLDSGTTKGAVKANYPKVMKEELDKLEVAVWKMRELRGLVEAAKVYAPILGDARKSSGEKDKAQGVTSIGKLKKAIDENTAEGERDSSTLGEYFRGHQNIGMFGAGASHVDSSFKAAGRKKSDNETSIKATAIHEMAHGLVAPEEMSNWVQALEYWQDRYTASGKKKVEAPPTSYGKESAEEDLCESVSMYFINKAVLESKCPIRAAFVDKVVKAWTPPQQEQVLEQVVNAKGAEQAPDAVGAEQAPDAKGAEQAPDAKGAEQAPDAKGAEQAVDGTEAKGAEPAADAQGAEPSAAPSGPEKAD